MVDQFEDELRRCCREVGALTDKLTSMQADMTNTKTQVSEVGG